jgi:N-acyl-L-homoserine lactone synthetase
VPHTTPAHMIYSPLQQLPSMSLPPPSPAFPDLERFMSEVTNRQLDYNHQEYL